MCGGVGPALVGAMGIWCCFTLKLPSPASVTRPIPSHLAQALLRSCSGMIREIAKHGLNGNFSRGPSFGDTGGPKLGPHPPYVLLRSL